MEGVNPSVFVVIIAILVVLIAVIIYLLFRLRSKIDLPGELDPDDILPPPTGPARQAAKATLEQVMRRSGIDPKYFDTDRVVVYPVDVPLEKIQSFAAPAVTSCDRFIPGMIIGVYYNARGISDEPSNEFPPNEIGNIAYQVQIFEETIVFFNERFNARIVRDAFFTDQIGTHKTTVFFVEGTCHLCGCIAGRCGCLVCI